MMHFLMKAGECMVFDNHRIVHGRSAYSADRVICVAATPTAAKCGRPIVRGSTKAGSRRQQQGQIHPIRRLGVSTARSTAACHRRGS